MSEASGEHSGQFDSKTGAAAAQAAWQSKREEVLKGLGFWEVWGNVPPAEERDHPIEHYLPEGYGE